MSVNINLIRQSFARTQNDSHRLANRFYDLLHQQYEPSRSWLPTLDLRTKEKIFLSLLQLTVDNLHKPVSLAKYLEHLGRKYLANRADGCLLAHYRAIGESLMQALEMELYENWNLELADEWVRTFNFAAGALKRGASQTPSQPPKAKNSQGRTIQITVTLDDDFRIELQNQIRKAIKAAVTDEIRNGIHEQRQDFIPAPLNTSES